MFKMKKILFVALINLFLFASAKEKQAKDFLVISYNVENFFDCIDDSTTNDKEFLPNSIRRWDHKKFEKKKANISKVIAAIGKWEKAALIGLCEIENKQCLIELTKHSPLKNLNYKFLHHESPDPRGIDVALLYDPKQFKPIEDKSIPIKYPSGHKTRDILFTKGVIANGDTLWVFVCHFPSRLGGELESENKRIFVSTVLRSKIDSIFAKSSRANIIIMGDFNDTPLDKSIREIIKAQPISEKRNPKELYNLTYKIQLEGKGTNKYKGQWATLDQMIVSGNLLSSKNSFNTDGDETHVFDDDFLLEDDVKYLGKQPFRTYIGMKYHNGFSDHLPIYTHFKISN